ncbi:MAG: S-formylglutathione hydrolase [Geminicoccaceae bacterium]|nr:MAG: S-formylglutathione hydrolase [Geminicoccaceae bacterium]
MSLEVLARHKAGGGVQGVYAHRSEATGTRMEFSLYLPPQVEAGPVPLVVYLSGLTCTWENVTTKGQFQAAAAALGLAVLCPDTSPRGLELPHEHADYDFGSGAGFYVDATEAPWHRHYRMATYVHEELPALVAAEFPIDRTRVGITGHSMGGHGALTLALKHPESYRSVSAFAPIAAPMRCSWGLKALMGYLGGEQRPAWRGYDTTALLEDGHRAGEMLVDVGTADPFLATQLKPELLEAAALAAGQPLTLRRQDGYDHSYYFVATFLAEHLAWHAERLQAT